MCLRERKKNETREEGLSPTSLLSVPPFACIPLGKLVSSEVAQLCLTLCDPMDCSLPGSSVRGILQARILGWVAISSSRGPSQPGIEPGSPALQADSTTDLHLDTQRKAEIERQDLFMF